MRITIHKNHRLSYIRSKKLWVTAAVLALTAALPAFAAQRGDDSSRLSLKISGGTGLLSWGDVEYLKDSYSGQIQYASSLMGIETAGTCANPGISWQGEVELRFDLSRHFGLGLAIAQNRRSGETKLTADLPPFLSSSHIWNQSTSLTTAVLNAYLNIPLNTRFAGYIMTGAGYGSAEWKYKNRDEETIDIESWEQVEGIGRNKGFLIQAGFGFEFRLSHRWHLFVEARGQLTSFGDWKAAQNTSTDATETDSSGSLSYPEKLWLAEIEAFGGRPTQHILLSSQYSPDPGLYDWLRAFRMNFSGVVFQVGFRIGLGIPPNVSDIP